MYKKNYITNSAEETKKIGSLFSRNLKPGDVIFLSGELGSGKTTFIQGLLKGLGISERVISPTFIIIRQYELKVKSPASRGRQKLKVFYHIDLYRTKVKADIKSLGMEEILGDREAIVAIEWPERILVENIKSRVDFRISFKNTGQNSRKIEIEVL